MNQKNNAIPLYKRSLTDEISDADRFEGDLFERADLAKRLTSLLERLPDGAVLSIDSPWGEGKTWFGKRWQASLGDAGYRTAYIDCFAQDHIDDPFSMVAGEILELAKSAKSGTRAKLLDAGKKIAVSLLPSAVKFAVNTVGHWAVGNAELADDIAKAAESIEESGAEKLEKLVAETLENYEADKKTLDGFRNSLAEIASNEDKPIVVFVDELDRCRPDFAVRTIERIKHFFDVPGVVFVLLINREQLIASIRGLYGQDVNADAYLGKFINLSLILPKKTSADLGSQDDNRKHCEATLRRYGISKGNSHDDFSKLMGGLAYVFRLSLRDVERAVVLYSFGLDLRNSSGSFLMAWPIALKLARPDLFANLMANDADAHNDAAVLAQNALKKLGGSFERMMKLFEELHKCGIHGFSSELPDSEASMLPGSFRVYGVQSFFSWLFERVDLSVSK